MHGLFKDGFIFCSLFCAFSRCLFYILRLFLSHSTFFIDAAGELGYSLIYLPISFLILSFCNLFDGIVRFNLGLGFLWFLWLF